MLNYGSSFQKNILFERLTEYVDKLNEDYKNNTIIEYNKESGQISITLLSGIANPESFLEIPCLIK